MAGVKGKSGRKRRYVRIVGYVTPEQARFVASLAPEQSDAIRLALDLASKSCMHAQCADVQKAA